MNICTYIYVYVCVHVYVFVYIPVYVYFFYQFQNVTPFNFLSSDIIIVMLSDDSR